MIKTKPLLFIIALATLTLCNSKKEDKSPEIQESIQRGSEVYNDFCMACHLPNGQGVPRTFPPLAKSDYLMNKRAESIKAIKYGQKGKITVNGVEYDNVMTPLGLSDQEVADVMNYITNSWGNTNNKMITEDEVSKIQP
ncbi:c-type cytochrome [Meridianimaribacter flavus]|uniref:Cytochrome c553 n=1 Tax=Meridianimaribacter flavus TaxID=571115 RepID=A0ABY2G415_9FLAO|nr:cytochrome c [Meridianimaribacter flavus]TDY11511.1 cytochrome c553 [Meridianimaribacter flavus]